MLLGRGVMLMYCMRFPMASFMWVVLLMLQRPAR
jgi:hypothetical protein